MAFIKLLILSILITTVLTQTYRASWDSIDSRPLPSWYDEAKIGIFIHWGVFSVPSFGSEWFWKNWIDPERHGHKNYVDFMKNNYKPNFVYPDFASQFTAEFYDPNHWADLFKASGAKYIVLTSKHHEGFCLWPSKYSFNWNSQDVGPKRDLLGDLSKAVRNRTDLRFGIYHSLMEWFNPLLNNDIKNKHQTQEFVNYKTMPELYELVNTYKPEVIWSDGQGGGDDNYWKSKEFIAWLYNESPVKSTVVVNDRWGGGSSCKHGGFYTCHDRYNPKVLQKHKWENCFTLDKHSWGFRREAKFEDYLTIHALLQYVAESVSCGGNVLINVGPTHDGRIVPIMEERLRQLGEWLKVNGEAIYGTTHWTQQNDTITPGVWFTSNPKLTGAPYYAIVLEWPKGDQLHLGSVNPSEGSTIKMLGVESPLKWKTDTKGIIVDFPKLSPKDLPQWVWVLKISKS